MLGNEGAYLPTDGSGEIPKRYWAVVDEAAKLALKRGLIHNEKDKEIFLNGVRARLTPQKHLPITEAVHSGDLIKRYEEMAKNPVEFKGLFTGLSTLDSTLLGVQEQNFMIICAATGVGKTLIANYLVANFATQGQKILYLALEESEEEVGDRWAKIVRNNHLDVPYDSVDFLYAEKNSAIKEDKQNIIPLIASAAQLGYTMVVIDMLNNLIDTVRDENSNVLLNRIVDVSHQSNIAILMTARLRQPQTDAEKNFPTMDSVYGRVDLGYVVSKCIALTPLPDEGDGNTYLRAHILKNRRKRIGMKPIWPKIRVSNLLEVSDVGLDEDADAQLAEMGNKMFGGGFRGRPPKGNTNGLEGTNF